MQIDELRGELATLADEIAPFERDVWTLHRRQRRHRVVMSAMAAGLAGVLAVIAVVAIEQSQAGKVRVAAGSRQVATDAITRIDVVIVPASPAVQHVLETSPLVVRYARVLRGSRNALMAPTDTHTALCALEQNDGFAVQATASGTDLSAVLARTLGAGISVYDVSNAFGFDLEVFLRVGASPASADPVRRAIASDPDIASFRAISQTEAYKIFKQDFADQPGIVASTKPTDLPESFRITLEYGASAAAAVKRYERFGAVDTTISPARNLLLLAPTTPVTSVAGHVVSACAKG